MFNVSFGLEGLCARVIVEILVVLLKRCIFAFFKPILVIDLVKEWSFEISDRKVNFLAVFGKMAVVDAWSVDSFW